MFSRYKDLEAKVETLSSKVAKLQEALEEHKLQKKHVQPKDIVINVGSRVVTEEEYKDLYTRRGFRVVGPRPKIDVNITLVEAVQLIMENQGIMFDHTASETSKAKTVVKSQPKLKIRKVKKTTTK